MEPKKCKIPTVEEFVTHQQKVLVQVKDALYYQAQRTMEEFANRGKNDISKFCSRSRSLFKYAKFRKESFYATRGKNEFSFLWTIPNYRISERRASICIN